MPKLRALVVDDVLDMAQTIANDLGDRVLVHDLPVNMEGIYGVKIIVPSLWGLEGPIPDAVPTRPRLPG